MKLITIQIIVFLLLISTAFAAESSQQIKGLVPPDLSTYPDMFIKDGNFNAVIVVGDKAPASDVIAQSNLIQFFVGYLGKTLVGSAKLASEIDALEQNIISIGSPCHNPVSAQIMIDPKPCDKWMEPGKAFIMLYYYKGYTHMVIEGYSDKGTREAVNALINYQKGSLRGANMLIEVDEPKAEINESGIKEEAAEKEEENITMGIEEEKEKIISELNEKIAKNLEDSNKKVVSPAASSSMSKTKEKTSSVQKQAIKAEQKKETSVIKKILNWFVSLFK